MPESIPAPPPPQSTPFVREAGAGPRIVCLHSNASHSGQWVALMQRLAGRFHVQAIDSYGSGKSPAWPSEHEISLSDEVRLIEPVLRERPDEPGLVLVGHSFGGAIALAYAMRHPGRVRAMALYEPTVFGLIDQVHSRPNATEDIRQAVADARAWLDLGQAREAARCFIDYWMGVGTWEAMPSARQAPIAESVRAVKRWGHAIFSESYALADYARLNMPILYLQGGASPESAQGCARVLPPVLPQSTLVRLPDLGHMAPVTHPEAVNPHIEAFLNGL